ncbi:AAA family ATPase [Ornithinimicrobium tianjinense]|uniref:ATP-binding protein n=1 Tax=Ornithinimicrobium tianjinense TaxID=1195761 RepID=A0A917BPH3_9MICO|nr:AAA family ATPase [Ornithinimicrobium tianjinense]GGF51985.1 ATP-binding protein [Ornithinimicrobium tianjinense]
MYSTVAISGYRSLRDLRLPLGRLTLVTGANGTGKSSVYRALRLLADCGAGRVVGSLAREGGLESALWAGPETLGGARRGYAVEGTVRKGRVSLLLGVGGDELSYLVDLGIPVQSEMTVFNRDPEVKREAVWSGPVMRPATLVARRKHHSVELRDDGGAWAKAPVSVPTWASMLTEVVDPVAAPELWAVREALRSWRFYDGFRVDAGSPARRPQVGTRTWVLSDDGSDLAAALQTIREDSRSALDDAVADAFDGARLEVVATDGLFDVRLHQPGMLRPLRAAELSDGTLRYLLWLAALLTPVPPRLMALNEPETSLHPSLVGPLARLVVAASRRTQIVLVTHSKPLLDAIAGALGTDLDAVRDQEEDGGPPAGQVADLRLVELAKDLGETQVVGQGLLSTPSWEWGSR